MQLKFDELLLLGMLTAAVHWLLARAEITRFAWSRAHGRLDELMRCPSCAGWWLGLGLGFLGVRPFVCPWRAVSIIASGLLAVVLTPITEAVLLWGLQRSRVDYEEIHDPPPPDNEDTTTPVDRPVRPQS